MPTYDYVCDECGHEFEDFHSMSAPPLKKCPKCKKNKLRRLIGTGAGIIFKGSGFYETDYKKKSKPSNGGAISSSDKSGSDSKAQSESKSDAKSDTKSDTKPKTEAKKGSSDKN